MKIILFISIVLFAYLLARVILAGVRMKRGAEQVFQSYWEAKNRGAGPGFGTSGYQEKDISHRARVIEEEPTGRS